MKQIILETFSEIFDELHSSRMESPEIVPFPTSHWGTDTHFNRDREKSKGAYRFYFKIFEKIMFASNKDDMIDSIKHIIAKYDFNHPAQIAFLVYFLHGLPKDIGTEMYEFFYNSFVAKENPSLWKFFHVVNDEHFWNRAAHLILGLVDGPKRRDLFFKLIDNTYVCKKRRPQFKLTPKQQKFAEETRYDFGYGEKQKPKPQTADQAIAAFVIGCFNYSDEYYLKFFKKHFSEEDKKVLSKYIQHYLLGDHFPDECFSASKLSEETKQIVHEGILSHLQKNPTKMLKTYARELISAMKVSDHTYQIIAETFIASALKMKWESIDSYDMMRVRDYVKAFKEEDVSKLTGNILRSLGGDLDKLIRLSMSKDNPIPEWAIQKYVSLR